MGQNNVLKVDQLSIPKASLEQVPDAELGLFFLAAHAVNEMVVFSKLSKYALRSSSDLMGPRGEVQTGQTLIILRIHAAKLNEIWKMFRKNFVEDSSISAKYLSQLNLKVLQAYTELTEYFTNPKNLADLRNSTFHMPDPSILTKSFSKTDVDFNYVVFMAHTEANLFSVSAEALFTFGVQNKLESNPEAQTLDELYNKVQQVWRWLTDILIAYQIAVWQTYFPEVYLQPAFEVLDVPLMGEISLPFFVREL